MGTKARAYQPFHKLFEVEDGFIVGSEKGHLGFTPKDEALFARKPFMSRVHNIDTFATTASANDRATYPPRQLPIHQAGPYYVRVLWDAGRYTWLISGKPERIPNLSVEYDYQA